MTVTIARRYVEVGGRLVHYRCCGAGPAVVLLHDSPRSSRLHLPTMRDLASRFRVFALDTPGYGHSQPLGLAEPRIADFAAALGAALAALGLERAPLYATHTSAKIALGLATRPEGAGLPHLLLDGLSIPDRLPEPAFIDAYMRPFEPDPDGAYLAREWTRIRDMLRWFPWFDRSPARRTMADAPDPQWLADYGADLFAAGPHYADAYRAAMQHDPRPDLLAVRVPTTVAARADDVLYGSLDKVPVAANPALSVRRLPAQRTAWLNWLTEALAGACDESPVWPGPSARPVSAAATPPAGAGYVDLPHGQLRFHRHGAGPGRPLLVLAAPTTLHARAWAEALAGLGPVIVPELPGYGESDPLPAETAAISHADALADCLAGVIANLAEPSGAGAVDLLGIGLAAPLAARLAARHPQAVRAVVIDGAPPLDPAEASMMAEGLCPAVPFDALAGSHLHRLWHMLRDAEVQWPWHDPSQPAVRRLPPRLAADELHAALQGLLLQPVRYGDAARAALAAGTEQTWSAVGQPALVFTHPEEPAHRPAPAIAACLPGARTARRPDSLEEAARACRAFLDDPHP